MNKRQKIVQERFLDNEEAVIEQLKSVYGQSLKDITDKISDLDSSIAELQKALADVGEDGIGDLAAAYLKGKNNITPEEAKATLRSMLQSKVYQKNYQVALKKQVEGILDKMQDNEFKVVSDYLEKCYEDGFVGTMFDLQGQGIPMCFPLDQEAMVRAVQLDSKISKGLYNRLGEDVSLLKKKITAQVSRGIATGMSFQQVAQQLAKDTNIGFNNAVRIARTEGHRVQVQSGMDACYKAKEKGADVVKQWDATMDVRTRESHVAVDGEIRELDKAFSNGLMFPGDPSGGAAEVINCRCALLQRARWAVDGTLEDTSFTKYIRLTNQVEEFDSLEDYDEFKKAYFSKENRQYMNYVEQMQVKYGTNDFATVLEEMSDREYNHYSKLMNSNPVLRRKKTDEGVFNTFNATKADTIRPRSIMSEMSKSEIGKELLEYLNKEKVPVWLYYGVDNPGGLSGSYDPIDDVIRVFCDVTKTKKESALTVIHEAMHRKLGAKGTFEEEVECFKAELMHKKRVLTKSDIDGIILFVKKQYPDLL